MEQHVQEIKKDPSKLKLGISSRLQILLEKEELKKQRIKE